jgi:2-amino-4-hydroxy-6-hydroxymethyldihydropteridine diphosphokinase
MLPHIAYIQIGTNMGDRFASLNQARQLLSGEKLTIKNSSSIYETAAWGQIPQPDFLNQIICIHTSWNPDELMQHLLATEKKMGRIRTEKKGPRVIDLDILFFDDLILSSEIVTIPHPLLQERRFILEPMVELDPDFIHPVFKKSCIELLQTCEDPLPVKKWIAEQKIS